jgi:hypothetical protein
MTDHEVKRDLEGLETVAAKCKVDDRQQPASQEEVDQMFKGFDGLGEERPVAQNVQDAVSKIKAYELERDRSQLISLLERAETLAVSLDEPELGSSLQKLLARLRG